ncbi:MAG: lysophospholipid acyltransferase family protein [Acidobacteria bacterium]|nr:lysophospholipid acyltransferase family protein [Acidobacteriota bacterium]
MEATSTPADRSAAAAPAWQRSWRRRLEIWAIAAVGTPLLRLLASTWRWRVEGEEHLRATDAAGLHGIHAFWHGRILPGMVHFRDRGIVVITSENFDGEWIARIIRRFGFGTARGSSSRGARKALLQLVRDAREHPTAFTLDGPRGPARVAQPGAVWLSKATGNPVIPFHLEASRYWTLRSWDRTQIPKPFSTVALVFGQPFTVPRDADDEALEHSRVHLEEELARCETRCHVLLQGHR